MTTTALILPEGGYLQPRCDRVDVFLTRGHARTGHGYECTIRIVVPSCDLPDLRAAFADEAAQKVLQSNQFSLVPPEEANYRLPSSSVIELRRPYQLGQRRLVNKGSVRTLKHAKTIIHKPFAAKGLRPRYWYTGWTGHEKPIVVVLKEEVENSQGLWLMFTIPRKAKVARGALQGWHISRDYCNINLRTGLWEVGALIKNPGDFPQRLREEMYRLFSVSGAVPPFVIFRRPNPSNPL